MLRAWVLYYDGNQHHFEERSGNGSLFSIDPLDWGLPKRYDVILVIQQAQFIQAWLKGEPIRRW